MFLHADQSPTYTAPMDAGSRSTELRNYQTVRSASSLLPWWRLDLSNLYHSSSKNSCHSYPPRISRVNPLGTSDQGRTGATGRRQVCFPMKLLHTSTWVGSTRVRGVVTPQRPMAPLREQTYRTIKKKLKITVDRKEAEACFV